MADELITLEDQRLAEINKVAKEKTVEYFKNFGTHRTEYGFRDASEYRYGKVFNLMLITVKNATKRIVCIHSYRCPFGTA